MENLAFVEINTVKDNKKNQSIITNNNMNSLGFMGTLSSGYKTKVSDITLSLSHGTYVLKTKYTLIYLYDYFDDEARMFLESYGGQLNNHSELSIPILTFFSQKMVDSWADAYFKELIKCPSEYEASNIDSIVRHLSKEYKVEKLPSLIVTKNNDEMGEEFFVIPLKGYKSASSIFNIFKKVIEIIKYNYNKDFLVIKDKLCDEEEVHRKEKTMGNKNIQNCVDDIIAKYKKKKHLTYIELAAELYMTDRNLRDKRSDNTLTREECLYLGLRLGIKESELNNILLQNNQRTIGLNKRDGIIRQALINKFDCDQTNEMLIENGYEEINKKDDKKE